MIGKPNMNNHPHLMVSTTISSIRNSMSDCYGSNQVRNYQNYHYPNELMNNSTSNLFVIEHKHQSALAAAALAKASADRTMMGSLSLTGRNLNFRANNVEKLFLSKHQSGKLANSDLQLFRRTADDSRSNDSVSQGRLGGFIFPFDC